MTPGTSTRSSRPMRWSSAAQAAAVAWAELPAPAYESQVRVIRGARIAALEAAVAADRAAAG